MCYVCIINILFQGFSLCYPLSTYWFLSAAAAPPESWWRRSLWTMPINFIQGLFCAWPPIPPLCHMMNAVHPSLKNTNTSQKATRTLLVSAHYWSRQLIPHPHQPVATPHHHYATTSCKLCLKKYWIVCGVPLWTDY